MRSRLTRRTEKQSRKQLIKFGIGTFALLFTLYFFGPVVINFVGNISDALHGKNEKQINFLSNAPYQAPILDALPEATPSSSIIVSGRSAYKDGTIELYVNDNLAKEITLDQSTDFIIENVSLSNGENNIKAKYKKADKTSEFSQEYKISFVKDAPKLDITTPQDNSSFSKGDQEINISGKTDQDNSVTINSFKAIVQSDGNFSYTLKLTEGENKITIEAINTAGKTTSKLITVSYKP